MYLCSVRFLSFYYLIFLHLRVIEEEKAHKSFRLVLLDTSKLYAHRYKVQLEYQKFVYYVVNANWIIYYKYSMVKKEQPSILSHYTFVKKKKRNSEIE